MAYDSTKHHRRSIRLHGYDYARAGLYFVTICGQDRTQLFGEVVNGEMQLSDAGVVIESWWCYLPGKFPQILMDAYVVMPNHLHGIVMIGAADGEMGGGTGSVGGWEEGAHGGAPRPDGAVIRANPARQPVGADPRVCPVTGPAAPDGNTVVSPSLGTIIQWFKTMSTNDYIRGVKLCGWPPFRGRLWQRNYYDRIIRNDQALDRARHYIAANPANWERDVENPLAQFDGRDVAGRA